MSPKVSLIQSLTVAILRRVNDTESHSYLTKASCIIILHLQKSGTVHIKAKEVDRSESTLNKQCMELTTPPLL